MLWNDLADQDQHGLSKRRVVKKRRGSGRLKGCWAQREGQPGALPKTSKDQNVCGYTNRSLATTTQRGSTPQDKGGFYQSAAVTGWFVAHVWMSVIFLPLWSSTVEGFTPQTSRIHSVFLPYGWRHLTQVRPSWFGHRRNREAHSSCGGTWMWPRWHVGEIIGWTIHWRRFWTLTLLINTRGRIICDTLQTGSTQSRLSTICNVCVCVCETVMLGVLFINLPTDRLKSSWLADFSLQWFHNFLCLYISAKYWNKLPTVILQHLSHCTKLN